MNLKSICKKWYNNGQLCKKCYYDNGDRVIKYE